MSQRWGKFIYAILWCELRNHKSCQILMFLQSRSPSMDRIFHEGGAFSPDAIQVTSNNQLQLQVEDSKCSASARISPTRTTHQRLRNNYSGMNKEKNEFHQ